MSRISTWLVLAGLLLALGVANYNIRQKQQVLDGGRQVLLELRPVDPRSLIQGDYMQLAYAGKLFPSAAIMETLPRRGTIVLAVDAQDVAVFSRLDDGSRLAQNELRLKYKLILQRWGGRTMRIGAESFLFQEGRAELYENASYGVLRVDESGDSVLVGLADEERRIISPP